MVEVVFKNGYKTKLNKTIAERLHAKGQILWPDEVEKSGITKKKTAAKTTKKSASSTAKSGSSKSGGNVKSS